MLQLTLFFIVLAVSIAVCAAVYLSVAKFPPPHELRPDANGDLGPNANRHLPPRADQVAGRLEPGKPAAPAQKIFTGQSVEPSNQRSPWPAGRASAPIDKVS